MRNEDHASHPIAARHGIRRVFIVDEDEIDRSVLRFLIGDDFEADEFESIAAAECHARWPGDLVIVAARLVASYGPNLIARWRVLWSEMKVFVVCEACDDDCVVAALQAGADDALIPPLRMELIRDKIERATDHTPHALHTPAHRPSVALMTPPRQTPARKM